MKKTTSNKKSKVCVAEPSQGSGKGKNSIGDWPPQACESFTFGFYLSMDEAFPDDYLNLIKPYIDLDAFENVIALTVEEAISQTPWEAIPLEGRRFLSGCCLVQVDDAHIHLEKFV